MTYEQAKALFDSKDYAGAESGLRELTTNDPGTAENWRLLAHALANQGKVDEAAEAASKAKEIQPAYAESRYTMGYVLGAQKKWKEATVELESALALDPMHQSAKQGLVFSCIQLGGELAPVDLVEAERAFRRAYEVDSHSPHAASSLLNFLITAKRTREADIIAGSLSNDMKVHPILRPIVEKLGRDAAPVAMPATVQVDNPVANQPVTPYVDPTSVIRPQDNPHSGQLTAANIPCPHCGLPINHIVIMCPHCNRQVRQSSVFAGRDTGPNIIWQEVALTVVGVLWCILNTFSIVVGFAAGPIGMFLVFIGAVGFIMGLGFIFKWDFILGIAKWLIIMNLMLSCLRLVLAVGSREWLAFGVEAVFAAIAGFTLYLVNYNSDY